MSQTTPFLSSNGTVFQTAPLEFVQFPQEDAVAQGSKAKYTKKQKRKARHIEEGYEKRGVSKGQAEKRAWATVNSEDHGGKKSGGGRGKKSNHAASRRGGRKMTKARAGRKGGEATAAKKRKKKK